MPATYCRVCSPVFGLDILRKLLYCVFLMTSCRQSTVVTSLHLSYLICRRRSTQSTIAFFLSASTQHLASLLLPTAGFGRTCLAGPSASIVAVWDRPSVVCCAEYPSARCWDAYSSLCTSSTSSISSRIMAYRRTSMLTIHRCMAPVGLPTSMLCRSKLLVASTASPAGWSPTRFS